MKASMTFDGQLTISAETELEVYALNNWVEVNFRKLENQSNILIYCNLEEMRMENEFNIKDKS